MAAPLPGKAGRVVWVEPGTLMEKMIPANLVDPYLTSQRWVITGFAYRAADAARARPPLDSLDTRELWVLRWRSLDMQTYLSVSRIDGDPYQRHGRAVHRAGTDPGGHRDVPDHPGG